MNLGECKEKIPCILCKKDTCCNKELQRDCPKWQCDRFGDAFEDCISCAFLKSYLSDMYGKDAAEKCFEVATNYNFAGAKTGGVRWMN